MYTYHASTSFTFASDGTVKVTSVSSDHDTGEEACPNDTYRPAFASATGMNGTYTLAGDTVTVTIGGVTFVFALGSLQNVNRLTTTSTTADPEGHGYFTPGTLFER